MTTTPTDHPPPRPPRRPHRVRRPGLRPAGRVRARHGRPAVRVPPARPAAGRCRPPRGDPGPAGPRRLGHELQRPLAPRRGRRRGRPARAPRRGSGPPGRDVLRRLGRGLGGRRRAGPGRQLHAGRPLRPRPAGPGGAGRGPAPRTASPVGRGVLGVVVRAEAVPRDATGRPRRPRRGGAGLDGRGGAPRGAGGHGPCGVRGDRPPPGRPAGADAGRDGDGRPRLPRPVGRGPRHRRPHARRGRAGRGLRATTRTSTRRTSQARRSRGSWPTCRGAWPDAAPNAPDRGPHHGRGRGAGGTGRATTHSTLGAVAAALGVRAPSLYNHVDGLDEIRRRLRVRAIDALGDALQRATVGRSGDEAVRTIARAYRAFALDHPGLYAATVPSSEVADADVQQAGARVVETVVAALSGFDLDPDDGDPRDEDAAGGGARVRGPRAGRAASAWPSPPRTPSTG